MMLFVFFFFKQKTAYEMRISDWSSDVCSSDLWIVSGTRRDVLIGTAAFAAAGLAWRLTPKRTLDLVSDEKLAEIVPAAFGLWSSRSSTQLVQPKTEGTLSAMLYSDTLTRLYSHAGTGERVMLLMAYGSTQSDLLQLHRHETCYPAFGYRISRSAVARLDFGARDLAVSGLIAVGPARRESIPSWTRVGDALPTSHRAQRLARGGKAEGNQ